MPILRPAMLAGAALLTLAACDRLGGGGQPKGSVIATVDGQEITSRQVDTEARARGLNLDAPNGAAARDAIVRDLVDRQLLVSQAKKQGIDRKPEVQAATLRAEETILAQAAIAPSLGPPAPVGDKEIDAFIKNNPALFADRRALHVDQIRATGEGGKLTMQGVSSMGDIVSELKGRNIPFERQDPVVDSAEVPPALVRNMLASPGKPFTVDGPGGAFYIALIDAKPASPSPANARAIATRALANMHQGARVKEVLDKLRSGAKITYQPGYAPKTPG